MIKLLLGMMAAVLCWPAAAQTVTDGDTIKLGGTTYRIFGIDAPEMKQWCGNYPAGVMAAGQLEYMIKGTKEITCEPKDTDRYGRVVAVCRADGRDLGKQMVRLGFAYAFTRYSQAYSAEEEEARQENIGVHAYRCQLPWEYRAAQRR